MKIVNILTISELHTVAILGFHVTSLISLGVNSTPNRYTVIRLKKIFTVCVDLLFGRKCVLFPCIP